MSSVQGLVAALALKQATLGLRGSALGTYLPGSDITFSNATVQVGSNAGDLSIVCEPSIAQVPCRNISTIQLLETH